MIGLAVAAILVRDLTQQQFAPRPSPWPSRPRAGAAGQGRQIAERRARRWLTRLAAPVTSHR
jgi:hypothetical protein